MSTGPESNDDEQVPTAECRVCQVDVPAGSGLMELVVTPLPPQTIDSSLYSEGTDGMRVLSTRYRTRAVKEDVREEVRAKEAEIRSLQNEAEKYKSDLKSSETPAAH